VNELGGTICRMLLALKFDLQHFTDIVHHI